MISSLLQPFLFFASILEGQARASEFIAASAPPLRVLKVNQRNFVIVGTGPAGLTAAYELCKANHQPVILEQSGTVGGLARTEKYKNFHFDMGGHRFFTKSQEVTDFWHSVLMDDFLERPRLSRIYYRSKFFNYPLKPLNALLGLGPLEAVRIIASYVRWSLFPHKPEVSFEHWVTNRFGKRLFDIFFKSYTEKVWGIPCSELQAEWAAQRIKNLSLKTAVLNMMFRRKGAVKSLIESFHYPRLGPGMLWRKVKSLAEKRGAKVLMNSKVSKIHRDGMKVEAVVVGEGDEARTIEGTDFISSMPLVDFVQCLDPPAPADVRSAASKLGYRDFLTVCLIVNRRDLFPDNWIYVHEPGVQVGRIQNFKNWSADMVPNASQTSLGLEYFCNEGDSLWNKADQDLIQQATQELATLGLASAEDVVDGCVFRMPKSYPVYDSGYEESLEKVKTFVRGFENFQTIGRNGLHRYNNQDHSMLTAMLAVRNALQNESHDLWDVNADQEFHEELRTPNPQPHIPTERHAVAAPFDASSDQTYAPQDISATR